MIDHPSDLGWSFIASLSTPRKRIGGYTDHGFQTPLASESHLGAQTLVLRSMLSTSSELDSKLRRPIVQQVFDQRYLLDSLYHVSRMVRSLLSIRRLTGIDVVAVQRPLGGISRLPVEIT